MPPPPHPTPPFRLLSSGPPFASWCPAPASGCVPCPPPPPPPPPPGVCPSRLVVPCSAFTLVASVPCGCFALLGRLLALPFAPPPPPTPPGRVSWVLAPAARFPLSSFFCLVFSVPLALAPVWLGFFFPSRLALVPPPSGCSWWSAVPRVLFCGAAVGCGLLCAARGVLLRRAVLLCGCLAVWCARLLCRWPSPVGVDHALSVGVAPCSASPCCFVWCSVVCGAVVRSRVLWCFPCCSVVSWLFSLCLLGFAHLRVCATWCCPPPPPPLGLCVVPSAGLCCRGVLACSALCGAVLLLAVLCFSGCGVPCRVVPCPVVLRGWRGAALRFLVRLPPAACSAVLGGAVLCCRALRRSLGCCVLVLCAVLSRCVLFRVALCRLVSVGVVRLAACCASLLFAAVCCAAPLGVVSGCAVLCCPRCGLLFRFRRAALCCAVPPCAVLGRVASCCAVWCCAVLSCVAPFARVLRPGALCCAVPLCAVVGCFVPSGVRWRCAVSCVLCFAVVRCCVLCCAFGRGVWLRCAVLSSLWLAVSFSSCCPVLCCASWCCVGPCRVVLCCVVLCCVVVRCAVRWGAASWCSVLCCPAVCCRKLLCAVWCPLALRGWLCAVLRCCSLLCAVLRLWAWCLVALCCAVLVVACCFVLVALPCAVLCLLVLCGAVSRRVVLLWRCAPRCGGGTVLRCLAVCSAASRCGVPSGAVRCLQFCVLCCVLCCAAVFCAVPGGAVSWYAVLCCSCRVLLLGWGLCSCVVCCVSWCCGAPRCILLFSAV